MIELGRSSSDSIRALVLGASGYIGSHLVPRLVEEGFEVRASSRNREVLEARGWDNVELVQADALDPGTLDPALADIAVAYYLVHSMAAGRGFDRLDLRAADNFRAAAARAGIRRIVYLGGLFPQTTDSVHLKSRCDTGERLRAGPVPVTELRAGMIIGPGSAAFEVIRDLVNHLPLMITPRWVRSLSTPIALDDLLTYLVRVPQLEEAAGRIYDVGGPEVLSYAEIMRRYGASVGRRARIIAVPVLSPRLSSYWLRVITSVPTNIARALIDGLRDDVIAQSEEIRHLVPLELKDFDASVQATLAAEQQDAVTGRWVEGSIECRNYRPDYAFYAKQATASAVSSAPREALWREMSAIGDDNGWYYLNILWWLRGALDWIVGGPSFRRRRRHPSELRVGDIVEAWRVIGLEPQARLTLLLEMKTPGSAVLELVIKPEAGGHRIRATAYFHPAGIWGLIYWHILAPFEVLIFRGLTRAIGKRAQARAAQGDGESLSARGTE